MRIHLQTPKATDAGSVNLHILIVVVFGVLAFSCVVGGIVAIYSGVQSKTEFDILGAHLKTSNVGIALVAIGLIIAFFAVREVLRNQNNPKKSQSSEHKQPGQTIVKQSNITTGGDNAGRDINKQNDPQKPSSDKLGRTDQTSINQSNVTTGGDNAGRDINKN